MQGASLLLIWSSICCIFLWLHVYIWMVLYLFHFLFDAFEKGTCTFDALTYMNERISRALTSLFLPLASTSKGQTGENEDGATTSGGFIFTGNDGSPSLLYVSCFRCICVLFISSFIVNSHGLCGNFEHNFLVIIRSYFVQ